MSFEIFLSLCIIQIHKYLVFEREKLKCHFNNLQKFQVPIVRVRVPGRISVEVLSRNLGELMFEEWNWTFRFQLKGRRNRFIFLYLLLRTVVFVNIFPLIEKDNSLRRFPFDLNVSNEINWRISYWILKFNYSFEDSFKEEAGSQIFCA